MVLERVEFFMKIDRIHLFDLYLIGNSKWEIHSVFSYLQVTNITVWHQWHRFINSNSILSEWIGVFSPTNCIITYYKIIIKITPWPYSSQGLFVLLIFNHFINIIWRSRWNRMFTNFWSLIKSLDTNKYVYAEHGYLKIKL